MDIAPVTHDQKAVRELSELHLYLAPNSLLIARLLLSELEKVARTEADQNGKTEEKGS